MAPLQNLTGGYILVLYDFFIIFSNIHIMGKLAVRLKRPTQKNV